MLLMYFALSWGFGLAYGAINFDRTQNDWDVEIFTAVLYALLMPLLLPVFALYRFFDIQAERKFIP